MLLARLSLALGVASALGLFLATACTTALGIDGKYVLESNATGGSNGTGGDGGTGGDSSGGSENVDAGRTASAGGRDALMGAGGARNVDAGAGGAAAAGAGGAPADPGCTPGRYDGTMTGNHTPSFALGLLPLPLMGTVDFTLIGKGPTLQMSNGSVNGTLEKLGAFSATLDGSYDCETHQLSAHMTGKMVIAQVDGTLSGDLLSSTVTSRSWAEHEVSYTKGNYAGSGTWDAKWTGP